MKSPAENMAIKRKIIMKISQKLNRRYVTDTSSEDLHKNYLSFIEKVNSIKDARILEVGSRNVTGDVHRNKFTSYKEYVGIDYHKGENVDVVGDAHCLSKHLPENHFDAVFCSATFEHLAMPWKVVLEINKVMKTGGLLFIATHPTWPPHELPWDFWRYLEGSFRVLLNNKTGFSVLQCNEGEPCSIVAYGNLSMKSPDFPLHNSNLGISVIAEKTGPPDSGLAWNIDVAEILDGIYPEPKVDQVPDPGERIAELEQYIEAMKASRSWRVTAPLRMTTALFKSLKGIVKKRT